MTTNPIDEMKLIRHKLGADVGFDVHRIFEDLRAIRASSDRIYADAPPPEYADNPMHGSGEAGRSQVDNQSSPPRDR